jgi:hypothetical protein
MPTARTGSWLAIAHAKGLIAPSQQSVSALPPNPTEKRFQAAVAALARRNGWEPYHTHNSKRSDPGWPDLALCRPPVLLLVELKTNTGRLSKRQRFWLDLLRRVPGVRVRLWRPSLWAAIVAELTLAPEGGTAQ